MTKSDPESVTNHTAPAPLLRCVSKFRFDQKCAQIGGGRHSPKAGNVLLLKLNSVVGNSVLVLHSNFRLPFYRDPTGFYSLERCLPPGLQLAEIIHRLLYFSYQSNDTRLDSPNCLSLDQSGVKKTLCRPLTFA